MATVVRQRQETEQGPPAAPAAPAAPPIVYDLQRIVDRYSKNWNRNGSADYWRYRSVSWRLSFRIYLSLLRAIARDLVRSRHVPLETSEVGVRTSVPSPGLREIALSHGEAEELQQIVDNPPVGEKRVARPVRRIDAAVAQ